MSKKITKKTSKEKIRNTSGWKPLEYRILILPDLVEETTKGGIILPETVKDDLQEAKTIATIVDFGAKAFDDGTWKDKPKIGDKIIIPSYCGYRLSSNQSADGREYRMILDRDILLIKNEEICQ